MPLSHQACILAIGTELTTGQITNRNAAWLSERLTDLGVEVVLHETVADDRATIRGALDRCRGLGTLIFVTGGLGPTTDDFTRDVVAQWLAKPLQFHEPSWAKINARLTQFGVPVAQSNRQQCFYPEGAEVIVNSQGTADAFTAVRGEAQVWVLPGPPNEVAAVWKNGIEDAVRKRVPSLKPTRLLTWQCIGKSEAELGEITERALAGSGLATGYRAHRPYVEVKVWVTEEEKREKAAYLEALDRAIAPWVATRQGEDLAALLLRELERSLEVEIVDAATGGILADRLGALLREPARAAQAATMTLATEWVAPASPREWVEGVLSEADPETITLAIAGFTAAGDWALGLREGESKRVEEGMSPWRKAELHDRSRRYATELALKRWREWLRELTQ
jgi:molybdenum cofactor synthesis domain-containing protein